MNYFDNEINILEFLKLPFEQCVTFPSNSKKCIELYNSLIDDAKFQEWVNSSGKADPPPDKQRRPDARAADRRDARTDGSPTERTEDDGGLPGEERADTDA